MTQSIEIGSISKKDNNRISFSTISGSGVGDISLTLTQISSLDPFEFKECNSRLSGHFGKDSNKALNAIYKLFTLKNPQSKVAYGSKGKIYLEMNNYQKYEAQKGYHVSLKRTEYGILLESHYNTRPPERAFDPRANTIEYEENITMHILEKSSKGLYNTLQFDPQALLFIDSKEFGMLEYLIENLPKEK